MYCQPWRAHIILMLARWWHLSWIKNISSSVDQYYCGPWSSWWMWSFCQFSLSNTLVVALVNFLSVDNTGGFRLLQYLPGSGGGPHSFWLLSAWNLPAGLRLRILGVFHCCEQVATPLSSKSVFTNGIWCIGAISHPPIKLLLLNVLRHIG